MTVAEHSLSQRNLCKKEEIQFEMEFRTFGLYLNYVLLSCLIGISSGVKPELTILDDLLDLTCGSRTLLTCKLHLQPAPTMSWNIGTNELTECTVTDCLPLAPQLDNYNASVDASTGKTYYLEIYPVRLDDSRQFTCSDGEVSDVIATSINALKIVKDEFSTYMKVEDNIVVYSRTSNCVEKANEMEHILKISKPNTNSFETYSVENTTEIIQCTDAENPNCGGKGTNKANFTITIQTDQVGDLYEFRLEVNYLGETISFQDIGSYNITNNNSDITTQKVPTDTQPTSATQPTNTTLLHSTKDTTTETNTDITTIVNSYTEVIEPIIILIFGVVIILVLIIACVMYIVCISVIKPTRRKTATFDNINVESHSTNM